MTFFIDGVLQHKTFEECLAANFAVVFPIQTHLESFILLFSKKLLIPLGL
jgi:hypothetical protein